MKSILQLTVLTFAIFSLQSRAASVDCQSRYPNGAVLHDGNGTLYYPNGALLRTGDGTLLYSNSTLLRSADGTMVYPTSSLLRTRNGRSLLYPDSTLMRFDKGLYGHVDQSGRVNAKVRIPSGNLYVSSGKSGDAFKISVSARKFGVEFTFDASSNIKCELTSASSN